MSSHEAHGAGGLDTCNEIVFLDTLVCHGLRAALDLDAHLHRLVEPLPQGGTPGCGFSSSSMAPLIMTSTAVWMQYRTVR